MVCSRKARSDGLVYNWRQALATNRDRDPRISGGTLRTAPVPAISRERIRRFSLTQRLAEQGGVGLRAPDVSAGLLWTALWWRRRLAPGLFQLDHRLSPQRSPLRRGHAAV